jgi:hypothetical protein
MTCSVKSLAPMTMWEERGGAQAVRVRRVMREARYEMREAREKGIEGLPVLAGWRVLRLRLSR